MAIPRSMGWLVVMGAAILALGTLSLLALDKPNVVWADGKACCPFCRHHVADFAVRCPMCREGFDWVAAPDEECPLCDACLSPQEDELLRKRRLALGDRPAAERVAEALALPPGPAAEWLKGAGRGLCGWCGGTGREPGADDPKSTCAVCFGGRRCVVCDGDRRVHVGVEAAERDLVGYLRAVEDLKPDYLPRDAVRDELRRLNEQFLARHRGLQACENLHFWPAARPNDFEVRRAPAQARQRLDKALRALAAD